MKPRRSQSHIPNCASCCSKSSAADTQWKVLGMCVRGCRIALMPFNYKDEGRLALGTTWCKVNLYFLRSCFILYPILCIWHLHVQGDQIIMNISMYSLLFWQDCVNFMVLPIVVNIRQSAMDALVGCTLFGWWFVLRLRFKLPAHFVESLLASGFCCEKRYCLNLDTKIWILIEESDVFVPDVRPPDMTVNQLRGIALGLNHAFVDLLAQAGANKPQQPRQGSCRWTNFHDRTSI